MNSNKNLNNRAAVAVVDNSPVPQTPEALLAIALGNETVFRRVCLAVSGSADYDLAGHDTQLLIHKTFSEWLYAHWDWVEPAVKVRKVSNNIDRPYVVIKFNVNYIHRTPNGYCLDIFGSSAIRKSVDLLVAESVSSTIYDQFRPEPDCPAHKRNPTYLLSFLGWVLNHRVRLIELGLLIHHDGIIRPTSRLMPEEKFSLLSKVIWDDTTY